jgi:hypothetical protein
MVPARYATARDPGRKTMGRAVAMTAAALRKPLMPWQRYVADVGGEVDDRGLYVNKICIVSVPRQSGKTTLDLAQSVQRCLAAPGRKAWHTAQTGQDARKKWREHVTELMDSPLRDAVKGRPRLGNGDEALTFRNGSAFRPHPPTRDALHGEQSDIANIDEAWVFDEAQGADLLQAIGPTQVTRPGAQIWIWSTRGTAASTWFHGLINRARAGEPGMALFDFGIPEDADPMDLDVVAAHHPALGYTITRESLAAELVTMGDKPAEFARAYGNRATGGVERVLPAEAWHAAGTVDPLPAGPPAFGVAVARDGSAAAVVAAVADADGRPWLEVLAHRPGRSWAVDHVKGLVTRHPGALVAVERRGPAGPVADALELADVQLLKDGRPDYPAACQDLFDRIVDPAGPRLFHRRSESLDASTDVAARRFLSDGAWVWSRTKSTGDVSPLEAGTLAAHAVARRPTPAPAPAFRFA